MGRPPRLYSNLEDVQVSLAGVVEDESVTGGQNRTHLPGRGDEKTISRVLMQRAWKVTGSDRNVRIQRCNPQSSFPDGLANPDGTVRVKFESTPGNQESEFPARDRRKIKVADSR